MTNVLDLFAFARPQVEALVAASGHGADGFTELLMVLCSRLNGCVVCTALHTRGALAAGETQERIDALTAWTTSELFSGDERLALAWAELLTLKQHHRLEEVRQQMIERFGKEATARLTVSIGLINAWNVLTIASHRSESARASTPMTASETQAVS